MLVVFRVENDLLNIVFWLLMVVRIWGFADSLSRKTAAFPAAGKLTKPAWVALNGLSVLLGYLFNTFVGFASFIQLGFLVATLVYLADVRPAVKEVSGGSRW